MTYREADTETITVRPGYTFETWLQGDWDIVIDWDRLQPK